MALRRWRGAWGWKSSPTRSEAPKSEVRALRFHPKQIITTIEQSGLRGRGGAGFPTGQKWRMVRKQRGRNQVRHLQRRRRRPRGVHGPHDPRVVPLPGHRRPGHRRGRRRRARGDLLHPPRVSAGVAAGEGGPGRVRAARLAGRPPAGERLPAAHLHQGRRRRFRLRRRDGADRLGGRPPRDAALAPAVPRAVRPVGQAHLINNVETLAHGAVDHPPRRGGVRQHRHRDQQGHEGVLAGRQDPPRRA